MEDWPGHGLLVELPGFEGYRGGFGGAGMTPGVVFDGIVDGAGVGGFELESEDDPLDPEEEPGCDGDVDEGGGVVGAGLEGSVVGSVVSVGSTGSVGLVGSVGSVGSEVSSGSGVSEGVSDPGDFDGVPLGVIVDSEVTSGVSPGVSVSVWSAVSAALTLTAVDVSAAEAGAMAREPPSTRAPTMAAQRRVERGVEYGVVARIRLLHRVRRQTTPLPL